MCISRLRSKSPDLQCQENFFEAIEDEQDDFDARDEWQDTVNSWTILYHSVYDRELIRNHVNFVPSWAFDIEYLAFKYEDPVNSNIMLCSHCFHNQYPGQVASVWKEEGIVEPFDFLDIYDQEDLWCMTCDKALFHFNSTD